MRWIQKGPEPAELTEYKGAANVDWKPTYAGLDKGPIRRALILEQGYLCCYCGGPVGGRPDDCHVEHFVAQSTTDEKLRLEYTNMLASCQGTDGRTRVPEHCGQARGTKPVPVSPLDPDCGAFFTWGADGTVRPSTDAHKQADAETTIRSLSLDTRRLKAAREAAIAGALVGLDDLPPESWHAEALRYDAPGSDGRLMPFCFAIQHVLSSYA
ncbi:MAG: retron system putative HNH endonuclease [Byssovorax sp.]